jgi:uncharacterized membrane protein HdeD (DUF308 family)
MDTQDALYLSTHWWVLTIRGLAAILFGLAAVFWPDLTLVTLVYLFSAFILVYGIIDIVHGLTTIGESGLGWILTLVLGFLQVGVGVYLLRHTLITFTTLVLLIGFMLIVRGVFEVVMAFGGEQTATSRTLLILGGVVTALAGIIVLRQPVAGGVAFVWVLGVFALITGPMLIAQSIDVKHALQSPAPSNGRKLRPART